MAVAILRLTHKKLRLNSLKLNIEVSVKLQFTPFYFKNSKSSTTFNTFNSFMF